MSQENPTVEDYNRFFHLHEKQFRQVNEAIMAFEFGTIRQIYIDLCCLKDTQWGLLYSQADEATRKYLIDNVEEWNTRTDREFLSAYPQYPSTEEELNQKYHDEALADDIFCYSPDTDFSYSLATYIKQVIGRNQRTRYLEPIKIFINAWPIGTSKYIKMLKTLLEASFSKSICTFTFINQDPTTLEREFLLNTDVFFLDNIGTFGAPNTTFYKLLVEETLCRNKIIFSYPCIDKEAKQTWIDHKKDPNNKEEAWLRLNVTALALHAVCHCQFAQFQIPTSTKSHK